MEQESKNEIYLLILSILLGISVLKLTEVFELGKQLREMINSFPKQGLSITVVGVYFLIAGYLIFFVLLALTSYGIVDQLKNKSETTSHRDLGPLVGMCVGVLSISYLIAFCVVIYGIIGR
jgi:hypothetical protein